MLKPSFNNHPIKFWGARAPPQTEAGKNFWGGGTAPRPHPRTAYGSNPRHPALLATSVLLLDRTNIYFHILLH